MKISEKMGLNKTQAELDFYDYDIDKDTYLFLDPYYIAKKEDTFLAICNEYIERFFSLFLLYLKSDEEKAKKLFSHLGEMNEICLGMSKGSPSGKGVGPKDTDKIFQSIKESQAFKENLATDLEDVRIFVEGVDKDKVSDMVANIIKYPLLEYTKQQCDLFGIKTQNVEVGFYWDKNQWTHGHMDTLVIDGKNYILFPRNLLSNSKTYTAKEYFNMYVLSYLQQYHLQNDTYLVKKRIDKNGNVKKRVYKKDIKEDIEKTERITKEWLARFTKENPEVLKLFKKNIIDKIVREEVLIDNDEADEVIDTLINKLKAIPAGSDYASEYHHLISGILELLFYPYISHPRIEQEIHEGRKRIDIAFDNNAETGFFFKLGTSYNVPCVSIMIECKNYSKDVKNPELDQMAGRFSAKRGKFGIICCRDIDNEELILEKERDTVKDDRGWMIHLTDNEIIKLLNDSKNNISVDDYLVRKFCEISQ